MDLLGVRTLTEAKRSHLLDQIEARLPEEARASWPVLRERLPLSGQIPAFEAVVISPEGRLWLGSYNSFMADVFEMPHPAQQWLILDLENREAGRVVTPTGLRVLRVGDDFVLGVHRDDLGVETVRRHRLDRLAGLDS